MAVSKDVAHAKGLSRLVSINAAPTRLSLNSSDTTVLSTQRVSSLGDSGLDCLPPTDPQSSDPNYPQGNLNVQDFSELSANHHRTPLSSRVVSLDWNSAPGPIIDIDRARSLRQRIPKVLTVNDPTAAGKFSLVDTALQRF